MAMVLIFFCIISIVRGVNDRRRPVQHALAGRLAMQKKISGAGLADSQAGFVTADAKGGPVAIHHRAFPQFLLAARAVDIGSDGIGSAQTQGKNKRGNLFHLLLSMLAIASGKAGNRVRSVVKIHTDFVFACYKNEYRPHLF
ncbi:hypothetical protein O0882_24625 [Janthinobacterium sp. SUN073]|uniref:hypothetical protein n=1 Tax=Janthinobacterium sp. SUN073 TaxID=3004102 RepID=UPI0025B09216|nr:hypothetical protein [Janthinobacterium sp. SUN073]MDN2699504.1 hypothetical protein [Janthinobacterium sp. SUN073]